MKIAFFGTKDYDRIWFGALTEDNGEGSYGIDIHFIEANINEDTSVLAKGHDAVCGFVNSDFSRPILKILHECGIKLILLRCAGFNNVDLDAAKEFGMTILRVPGYSPEAVAEHAMALALTTNRRIHRAYGKVRNNDFSLSGLLGRNFFNGVAGVVGTGKIGAAFANICRGFGMRVIAYDKYENPALKDFVIYVSLDELLEKSDLISLHCPLFPETYHMINKESIAKMKDTVILVNTSRGGADQYRRFNRCSPRKKFAAVGLDVYENEDELVFEDYSSDIIANETVPRLLSFPNVMITSHQAFFTREALQSIAITTLENAYAFEHGLPLDNIVQ